DRLPSINRRNILKSRNRPLDPPRDGSAKDRKLDGESTGIRSTQAMIGRDDFAAGLLRIHSFKRNLQFSGMIHRSKKSTSLPGLRTSSALNAFSIFAAAADNKGLIPLSWTKTRLSQ